MMPLPRFFADYQQRLDAELRRLMPANTQRVGEAMAYTLLAPSKRVRPVLTLLSAELCGGAAGNALVAACAVEMVHASSLILDDLPSMDDAATRRGRPITSPTGKRSRSSRPSDCWTPPSARSRAGASPRWSRS